MKKILISMFCFSILFLSNLEYSYSFNINKWTEYTQGINNIKNWNIYKNKIDTLILKNINNIGKLNAISKALENINIKINKLNKSKNKELLSTIVNYFLYKTLLTVEAVTIADLIEKEVSNMIDNEIDEKINNKIYTKSELYLWFNENYNDKEKTVLTWIESYVYNGSVVAWIEEIEVKEVIFKLESTDLTNIKSVIKEVNLYVEWNMIKNVSSSNVKVISPILAEIKISDINDFYIPKQQIEYRLWLIAQDIWFEKVWEYQPVINITEVRFTEVEWLVSNNSVSPITFNDIEGIETFQISASKLDSTLINSLNDSYIAKINIKAEFNKNTQQNSNSELRAKLEKLDFYLSESNGSATYEIANSQDSSDRVLWIKSWNSLEFDMSTLNKNVISKWKGEDYNIYITNNNDTTVFLELKRNWIIYSLPGIIWATNINAYLENNISIWSRTY